MKICKLEGCQDQIRSHGGGRGWCNKHYLRWYKYGDASHEVRAVSIDRTTQCSVVNCDAPIHSSKGFCQRHYMKWWRHGNPNFEMPIPVHNTRTYKIWTGMKQRCDNPKTLHYDKYGGRGITYDKKWKDFRGFLEDMGERPDGLSLDRKDNNGNYTKSNCRWATSKEQMNNTRANVIIELDGVSKNITEWSEVSNIYPDVITWRIRKGWNIKRAIFQPISARKNPRKS